MRKALTLMTISVLCVSILLISALETKAADGEVGYWNFEEGVGTTAADSSGQENDGVLINGPTWVNGKYGKALSFDGVDDYVQVQDSNSLHLSTSVTLMAWIYLPASASYAGDDYILGKQASNGGTNLAIGIRDPGYALFGLGISYGSPSQIQNSANLIQRDTWSHIAATYDGSLMKIYIDGVLNSAVSWTSGFSSNTNPLTIGSKNPPYVESFIRAIVDEVKIFDAALTNQEILEEMGPPTVRNISLTPSTGFASTTIAGSGFSGNSKITIDWDGATVPAVPDSLSADIQGDFTAIISVPTQTTPGTHTVKATDESGEFATATFTVTDMTGPQGLKGDKGEQGEPGAQGEQQLLMIALPVGASILAIGLAAYALFKKRA